jgi:hypothetical protein
MMKLVSSQKNDFKGINRQGPKKSLFKTLEVPKDPEFQNSEYKMHQVGPNDTESFLALDTAKLASIQFRPTTQGDF